MDEDTDSVVDFLKHRGLDSTFAARKHLAEGKYGIPDYTGTAAQNIDLLAKLRQAPVAESYWQEIKDWLHKLLSAL